MAAAMTVGVVLAPAATAQSNDADVASLSIESDLGQTRMFPAFDRDVLRYDVAVPSGETEVTVSVETSDSGASVGVASTRSGSGHQYIITPYDTQGNHTYYTVAMRTGATDSYTPIYVTVTAANGDSKVYRFELNAASTAAGGWRVYEDLPLNRLIDREEEKDSQGNTTKSIPSHFTHGLWASDSRVMVTARRHPETDDGNFDHKLLVFDTADGSRLPGEEFALDVNPNAGIWSDGTTLWAMDDDGRLVPYDLQTQASLEYEDVCQTDGLGECELNLDGDPIIVRKYHGVDVSPGGYRANYEVVEPRGLWSDGKETFWVVDRENTKVFAFKLPEYCDNRTKYCRQPSKDFDLDPANARPWGITAVTDSQGDVVTWWVTDIAERTVFAYNPDGSRDSTKDIDLTQLKIVNGQQYYYGLAATDDIIYVVDFITSRVYSFNIAAVQRVSPELTSSDATLGSLTLRVHMETSDTPLSDLFTPGQTRYTAQVEPDVTSIIVTATPNHSSATAVIKDDGVITTNGVVSLGVGNNTITVEVTAEDGTEKTYTVIVNRRAKSKDATLSGLALSGVLPEDLGFVSGTEDYDLDVANGFDSTTVTATANIAASTVTITLGSETTTSRTMATLAVDLDVGDNEIEVSVTAEDTAYTKTYTVTVDRDDPPPSTDATLSDLVLSDVTLNTPFSSTTEEYTASVVHGVASTKVTPTLNDSAASFAIELDDAADDEDIDLAVGANVIEVVVTAEDNLTMITYKVTVTREAKPISTDATLSNLVLSDVTLDPTFSSAQREYTALVANGVTSTTVTPTLNSDAASFAIELDDAADDEDIDLAVGANVIEVVVTAEDNLTMITYKVTVTREAPPISTDATLANLVLSDVTLDPTFSSAQREYTALVANGVTSTTVTPTLNSDAASFAIELDDAADDEDIDLAVGANVIEVVVTAEDNLTMITYKVTVTREAPPKSTDATLANLVLSDVTLDPTFSSAQREYTALVANGVTSTTVTPTLNDAAASYAIELDDTADDEDVDLAVGANVIDVVVTAEDNLTMITYKVTVTREAKPISTDATLANLVLSQGTLNPTFSSAHETYAASVANGVESITVTPTLNSDAASYAILLDDAADDENVDLAVGANVIEVVVTAENGNDMKTYTVTVTRAAPSSQPGVNSNPGTFSPGTLNPGTSNPGGGSSNPGTTTVGESSGDGDSDSESDDFTPLDDAGDAGTDTEAAINALHRLGAFTGTLCQANRLCPNDPMPRWIAAVWLVRLIDGDDPADVTETRFEDVIASTMWEEAVWYAPHVERLADLEITVGCTQDPSKFCPDVSLTRAQTASWLARAFDLETDESQGFADAADSVHEANINAVVAAGVMSGCSTSPKNFCLTGTVTKGEMALYVDKARKVAASAS